MTIPGTTDPKADVPAHGIVPVAVGNTQAPRGVVPGAAAQDTVLRYS